MQLVKGLGSGSGLIFGLILGLVSPDPGYSDLRTQFYWRRSKQHQWGWLGLMDKHPLTLW